MTTMQKMAVLKKLSLGGEEAMPEGLVAMERALVTRPPLPLTQPVPEAYIGT